MADLIETLKLDAKLPEARAMRAKLEAGETHKARGQLDELAQKIIVQTELGRSGLQVTKLEPGVRAALERKGYKVSHYPGDQRDPAYYMCSG